MTYIGSSVEARAWPSDIIRPRSCECMRSITIGGHLDTADLTTWHAILCAGVWKLVCIGRSRLMICVEWACVGLALLGLSLLEE